MEFYKLTGTWDMGTDSPDQAALENAIVRLGERTEAYNQELEDFGIILCSSKDNELSFVLLAGQNQQPLPLFSEFENALDLSLTNIELQEITLKNMINLLGRADRNDYIDDEDDYKDKFKLMFAENYQARNEMRVQERLNSERDKEKNYELTSGLLCRSSLWKEMDRIYLGQKTKDPLYFVKGHPVQYMIATDDEETRGKALWSLLHSLLASKRLINRRVCTMEVSIRYHVPVEYLNNYYRSLSGGAVVVDLVKNNLLQDEDEYETAERFNLERICSVARKFANDTLTVFCLPQNADRLKNILMTNMPACSFVEIKEEPAYGKEAKSILKKMALERKLKPDKDLYQRISEDKGYLMPDLKATFEDWYSRKLKTTVYPQYKDMEFKTAVKEEKPRGSAFDELDEMIGLESAKKTIRQAVDFFKARAAFQDLGLLRERPSMHMVFTGNPGSAKTSAARLFARIMRDNGLLSVGTFVEVGRSDLVGKFVGWTAPIIKQKFEEAKGGVLFIDEAYSLMDDRTGSFGDEAINTIVQEMENHRDEVVVIFAGYPKPMEAFLERNPGLKSRIAFHVQFDDYTPAELLKIADLMAYKKGLRFSDDAKEKMNTLFEIASKEKDFGNGRYVRNVLEKAEMAQASRLLSMGFSKVTSNDVSCIIGDDIELPPISATKPFEKKMGFL